MTLRELYNELEDKNHDGLTAMLVAVASEDYDAVIRMGEIIKMHLHQGSMTAELCSERYKLTGPLYEALVANGKL